MKDDMPNRDLQGTGRPYPVECIETVTLREGSEVLIRPIRPDDAPRLQAGFVRLSPQTIYLRFLESFKALSDKQAYAFANVDYQTRMALVASVPENGDEALIGVARYATVNGEPETAEAAIVVGDEFQKRGLGTILLLRLVDYARSQGVKTFLATVHSSNSLIMRFIKKSEFPFERKMLEPGVWEVRIHIANQKG